LYYSCEQLCELLQEQDVEKRGLPEEEGETKAKRRNFYLILVLICILKFKKFYNMIFFNFFREEAQIKKEMQKLFLLQVIFAE
jgi:hypothetical protein